MPNKLRAATRQCPICLKSFKGIKDQNGRFGGKIKLQKYCSKACWSVRGQIDCLNCNKRFSRTEGPKQVYCSTKCAFEYMQDEKSHKWKGDKVSYSGLHKWVYKHLGKPNRCEHCGEHFEGRNIQWANKSGEYQRQLNDWIRLCIDCHNKYDEENGRGSLVGVKLANKARWNNV